MQFLFGNVYASIQPGWFPVVNTLENSISLMSTTPFISLNSPGVFITLATNNTIISVGSASDGQTPAQSIDLVSIKFNQ